MGPAVAVAGALTMNAAAPQPGMGGSSFNGHSYAEAPAPTTLGATLCFTGTAAWRSRRAHEKCTAVPARHDYSENRRIDGVMRFSKSSTASNSRGDAELVGLQVECLRAPYLSIRGHPAA